MIFILGNMVRKPWRIKNQSTRFFNENIKQLIFKDAWNFYQDIYIVKIQKEKNKFIY